MAHASATFEITGWDETTYAEAADGPKLSRATVRKIFRGDLVGESTAELLMSRAADDAAGYVALERITGSVGGRADAARIVAARTLADRTRLGHR
jgi:hypothetical protein